LEAATFWPTDSNSAAEEAWTDTTVSAERATSVTEIFLKDFIGNSDAPTNL